MPPPSDSSARVVDSIKSSLDGLYQSTRVAAAKLASQGPPQYKVPAGSQDIPHPRTIPDLLARTIFIQICAALAYILFIGSLKRLPVRSSRNFAAELSGPSWIWPCLSVLLPWLVFVQTGLWTLWDLFPILTNPALLNSTVSQRFRRHGTSSPSHSSKDHLVKAVVLMIPLYYAGKGYRQRLSKIYHLATYVANLGLDHRNGWAVISGLVCCIASVVVELYIVLRGEQTQPTVLRRPRASSILEDIAEEDENESGVEEKNIRSNGTHYRRSSGTLHTSPSRETSSRSTTSPSRQSIGSIFRNPDTMLPLMLTTVIHQIPLAATNRTPPLTAIFTTKWCLAIVPIVVLSVFTLPQAQRAALRRAMLSSSGDKMLVLFTLIRTFVTTIPWLLVGSTIFTQVWSDLFELQQVRRDVFQPWNYRWRLKDIFSHGDSDRVYMGQDYY